MFKNRQIIATVYTCTVQTTMFNFCQQASDSFSCHALQRYIWSVLVKCYADKCILLFQFKAAEKYLHDRLNTETNMIKMNVHY